jgi:hypothetical protein
MDQDDRHDEVLFILKMPPDQALRSANPSRNSPAAAFGSGPPAPCIAPFACSTNRFRIPSSAW